MSRSLKKGPYVQPKLLARVEKMNESGEKIVLNERFGRNTKIHFSIR